MKGTKVLKEPEALLNIADLWILEPGAEYNGHDNHYDKGYKELLSVKRVFVELLRSFVRNDWVDKINEDNVERIDKSFVLSDFKEKEADLVYRAKLDGKDIFFYILLELQSTVDFQMPYRLLQYMLEIWRTVLKDTDENTARRKGFRLPAIIPCVLYNGKGKWTACRSFKEILEGNDIFEDYILDFKYILFDVKRYGSQELEQLGNLIGAAFLVDQKAEFGEFLDRIKALADKLIKLSEEDRMLFRRWVNNTFLKSMPNGEETEALERELERVSGGKEDGAMIYAIEEAVKKELKKGRRIAREEGLAEGRAEGIAEAKIEFAQKAVKLGMAPEVISELTGLSLHEVKKLIPQ